MPGDAAQLLEEIFRTVKKVKSGYGEEVTSTKKSPTNAPLSHSDTSSLALVVSALQSAQCPLGGEQGRVAPLAASVKTKRSKLHVGSSSGNTERVSPLRDGGDVLQSPSPAAHLVVKTPTTVS